MGQRTSIRITRVLLGMILLLALMGLGNGTSVVQAGAGGPIKFTSVSAGSSHALALQDDGTVWSIGYNGTGQLGNGTIDSNYVKMIKRVNGLSNVKAISAGANHSVALKNDGTVWTWGLNDKGQLGNGSTTTKAAPVQVSGLSNVKAIVAGDSHNLALKSDGTLWAWGNNDNGQLGNNATVNQNMPIQVSGITNVKSITAGNSYSTVLKTDGTVWGWGLNYYAQLTQPARNPQTIKAITRLASTQLTNIAEIAAHGPTYNTYALTSDGKVYAWGYDSHGQLGNGTTSTVDQDYTRSNPVPAIVAGLPKIVSIDSGYTLVFAVDNTGEVWSWGSNWAGSLGQGINSKMRSTPAKVITKTGTALSNIKQVSTGMNNVIAVTNDGKLWGWGQYNDGSGTNSAEPVLGEDDVLNVSPSTTAPAAGASFNVTLTMKDIFGNTDTTFSGSKSVTLSGVSAAPDKSYGKFNGTAMTSGSASGNIDFTKGTATVAIILNKAGQQNLTFSADGFSGSATITPVADTATSLAISTQPVLGSASGNAFATQPKVQLKDAYGNIVTSGASATTTITASKGTGTGNWTLGGTTSVAAVAGEAVFTDLTATTLSGGNATLRFSGSGLTGVTSNQFTLPDLPIVTLVADTTDNDVDHDLEVTFTPDSVFEGAITRVSYRNKTLAKGTDYTISSGVITLKTGAGVSELKTPDSGDLVVTATGYRNSTVSQTLNAGKAASIVITTQPVPGSTSGQLFATQPKVTLKDKYGNITKTGPSAAANVKAVAEADTGSWTIGGTATKAAVAGVVTYTDLTSTLVSYGKGKMKFLVGDVEMYSDDFTIPSAIPGVPVNLQAQPADGEAIVRWDAVPGATSYKVYMSTLSGEYSSSPVTVTKTVYEAFNLVNGTTYYFQVLASNYVGDGPVSIEVNAVPHLVAPPAPNLQSASAGDASVTLDWSPVKGATIYNIFGSTESDSYLAPIATVSGSVYKYEIIGLTNDTKYYFKVQAANEAGGSPLSNELSVTPKVNAPGAPTDLQAKAGIGTIQLSWNGVNSATGYKIYMSTISGSYGSVSDAVYSTVTGNGYNAELKGLTPGTVYYFVVKAVNASGDSDPSNEASATPQSAPGPKPETPESPSGSIPSAPSAPSSKEVEVIINGKVETAGTATITTENNKIVTTIVVDAAKLNQKLEQEGNGSIVTIPFKSTDVAVGVLNGQLVKLMEAKNAVIVIQTDKAAYRLPASQMNIDAVSSGIGNGIDLKEINLQIQISPASANTASMLEHTAQQGKFSVVTAPLDFTITATFGDRTVAISKFNSFVERSVALPDNVDPRKITTGIVVESDGTIRHVPTKVVQLNGKYIAQINSLTNSSYSLIWNPVTFKDTETHWAKDAIHDMGSRMVISGTGNQMFEPQRDITRAEFTAMVVRSLGLSPSKGASSFGDVSPSAWYSSYIQTGTAYGLVSGYEGNVFAPDQTLTREQAMTILSRAMKLTGLKAASSSSELDNLLKAYGDAAEVSAYAKTAMAEGISSGLMSGRTSNELAPKAKISRAEVATLLRKLLQKSSLI
ncbi:hypothetical protein BC351_14750 [Paenibacillus ferrarius]|uniref:Uncharacterized protein n=1 Tax=Paenibacillus ferrarius TaxID=1469647 RepID=A0A1V4HR84_9BACL|nr:S-layer homology domain-containing protein [Paenibacillus ferrarius]OPH61204.1 hypothetical protein BC351_14750 [Paenibacillus ferrarius]